MTHRVLSAEQFRTSVHPTEYSHDWEGVTRHVEQSTAHTDWPQSKLKESVAKEGIGDPVWVEHASPDGVPGQYVVEGHHRVAAALATGADIPIHDMAPSWNGLASAKVSQAPFVRKGMHLGGTP